MTFIIRLGFFSAILFLSACLRVPTLDEQQKLVSDGAFPGGVPMWVYGSKGGQRHYIPGVIPTSFEATRSVYKSELSLRPDRWDDLRPVEEKVEEKQAATPLGRIAQVCGEEVERDASNALTTTDAETKGILLKALSEKCPTSWDIWFWLARSQLTNGDLSAAKMSLEKVLAIDRTNKEARELLSTMEQQMIIR